MYNAVHLSSVIATRATLNTKRNVRESNPLPPHLYSTGASVFQTDPANQYPATFQLVTETILPPRASFPLPQILAYARVRLACVALLSCNNPHARQCRCTACPYPLPFSWWSPIPQRGLAPSPPRWTTIGHWSRAKASGNDAG